jgi:AsmA protein
VTGKQHPNLMNALSEEAFHEARKRGRATRTVLKILGVVAGVVALVLIGAGVYLVFFFDANAYKPRIEEAAAKSTGRELRIDGDLSVSLFPSPHASISTTRLAQAEGFGTESPFAEFNSVKIYVRLAPLVRRRIEVEKIIIENPRLNLKKDKAGKANWADLGKKQPEAAPETPGESQTVGAFFIESLHLKNGEVRLVDEASGRRIIASNVEMKTGQLGGTEPANVEAKAMLASWQPRFDGEALLSGQIVAAPSEGKYGARDIVLRLNGSEGEPATDFKLELKGEGAFEQGNGSVGATFVLAALNLRAKAGLKVNAVADEEPRFNGRVDIQEFNPRKLLKHLGKPVPATRDRAALTRASFAVRFEGDTSRFIAHPSGRLDGSKLSGQITVRRVLEKPLIRFNLLVDRLDLDRYRPPVPQGPPRPDARDAFSQLSEEHLRKLAIDMRGEIKIGDLTLNRDHTKNFVAKLEWNL